MKVQVKYCGFLLSLVLAPTAFGFGLDLIGNGSNDEVVELKGPAAMGSVQRGEIRQITILSEAPGQVTVRNPGHNTQVVVRPNRWSLSLGIARNPGAPEIPPPDVLPDVLKVYYQGFQGGIYPVKMSAGETAYLTARHVLQSVPMASIAAAFSARKLNVQDFDFLGFSSANQIRDIVFILPKRQSQSSWNEFIQSLQTAESVFDLGLGYEKPLGLPYYSFQMALYPKQPVANQISTGKVQAIEEGDAIHFYLPAHSTDSKNVSTVASSGAPVYLYSGRWKIAGVIECYSIDSESSEGVRIPARTRVISLGQVLKNSEVHEIDLNNLVNERRPKDASCPITGGGRAGGDELYRDGSGDQP